MATCMHPISSIRNQHGATVVEFAVIAALLLLILFGILELGLTFLQRHYVANAAREGVRIGIRALNYNCFEAGAACKEAQPVYRKETVIAALTDCAAGGYLCTLYQKDIPGSVAVTVTSTPDSARKLLTVTVDAPNFMPPLVSGFVPGYQPPTEFTYTASGYYENPKEP